MYSKHSNQKKKNQFIAKSTFELQINKNLFSGLIFLICKNFNNSTDQTNHKWREKYVRKIIFLYFYKIDEVLVFQSYINCCLVDIFHKKKKNSLNYGIGFLPIFISNSILFI